jgi:hypothetical protein
MSLAKKYIKNVPDSSPALMIFFTSAPSPPFKQALMLNVCKDNQKHIF